MITTIMHDFLPELIFWFFFFYLTFLTFGSHIVFISILGLLNRSLLPNICADSLRCLIFQCSSLCNYSMFFSINYFNFISSDTDAYQEEMISLRHNLHCNKCRIIKSSAISYYKTIQQRLGSVHNISPFLHAISFSLFSFFLLSLFFLPLISSFFPSLPVLTDFS